MTKSAHQSTAWAPDIQAKIQNIFPPGRLAPDFKKMQPFLYKINTLIQTGQSAGFATCTRSRDHATPSNVTGFRALPGKIRGQNINFYSQVVHNEKEPIKMPSGASLY